MPGKTKLKQISFYVSEEDYQLLQYEAHSHGESVSYFCRELIKQRTPVQLTSQARRGAPKGNANRKRKPDRSLMVPPAIPETPLQPAQPQSKPVEQPVTVTVTPPLVASVTGQTRCWFCNESVSPRSGILMHGHAWAHFGCTQEYQCGKGSFGTRDTIFLYGTVIDTDKYPPKPNGVVTGVGSGSVENPLPTTKARRVKATRPGPKK